MNNKILEEKLKNSTKVVSIKDSQIQEVMKFYFQLKKEISMKEKHLAEMRKEIYNQQMILNELIQENVSIAEYVNIKLETSQCISSMKIQSEREI